MRPIPSAGAYRRLDALVWYRGRLLLRRRWRRCYCWLLWCDTLDGSRGRWLVQHSAKANKDRIDIAQDPVRGL